MSGFLSNLAAPQPVSLPDGGAESLLSRLAGKDPRVGRSQLPMSQRPDLINRVMGGINRFADELINPASPLGKLGAYVGAASGGVLGQAALANMRDQRTQGDEELNRQYKQAQIQKLLSPETFSPRYFESNNGDQYMIGQDGQPKLVFKDPTPKTEYQWVKNGDGTYTAFQMPIGGVPMPNVAPSAELPAGFTVDKPEGGAGSGQRPFR